MFFKIASGSGGKEFRTGGASKREGLFVYDLKQQRMLWMRERWGHPAWTPDSRQVIEVGNLLFDVLKAGELARIPDLPTPGGCHLAVSPDGKLFVMDGRIDQLGGKPGQWGIVVCDIRGGKGRCQVLHAMDNSRGARSWRKSHPHPVFSADGRRIYFNVNDTQWTRLFVAESEAAVRSSL